MLAQDDKNGFSPIKCRQKDQKDCGIYGIEQMFVQYVVEMDIKEAQIYQ